MSKDDGGPAFPKGMSHNDGMSLRDWFAGQAMAGIIAMPGNIQRETDLTAEDISIASYIVADAMLAHRFKGRDAT